MNTNPILKDKCRKIKIKERENQKLWLKKWGGWGATSRVRLKNINVKKKFIIENYLTMLLNFTLQLNFETFWHDSLSNPSLKINLSESCLKMTKST
jgi:hypothetical protein